MSQTVTLHDVKITDIDLLRKAIADMAQKDKIVMTLTERGKVRGYSGRTEKADYVLSIPGVGYTMGLNVQPDGSYMPRIEDTAIRRVSDVLGAQTGDKNVSGETCDINSGQAVVGRLIQRMNVLKIETAAKRQGKRVTRTTRPDGLVAIEVMGKAA